MTQYLEHPLIIQARVGHDNFLIPLWFSQDVLVITEDCFIIAISNPGAIGRLKSSKFLCTSCDGIVL